MIYSNKPYLFIYLFITGWLRYWHCKLNAVHAVNQMEKVTAVFPFCFPVRTNMATLQRSANGIIFTALLEVISEDANKTTVSVLTNDFRTSLGSLVNI